ncbi:hypothetical protein [Streptomyces sp. AC512_CC834]|uniref:hypothetical protein n=1 Tax=Streptomyces sp. AC512_CC834 TaxID=2823691 RepID=UPI001C27B461|nr:hypothetical protein [Streptomyces sp. AC512_CC834]
MGVRSVVGNKKVAAVLVVVGVVAVGLGTSAAVNTPEDTGGPLEHRFDKSPQELREYWTPERIKEAKQNGL